jgi:hypothetical protein
MVGKLTGHIKGMVPKLLEGVETATGQYTKTVFVLSNGAFTNPSFLSNLLQAGKEKARFIPIIAEDGFRFPSKEMCEELEIQLPKTLKDNNIEIETNIIVNLIQDVFKEIAIVFAPQDYSSTEQLLLTKAKDTSKRLLGSSLQSLDLRGTGQKRAGVSLYQSSAPEAQPKSNSQEPVAQDFDAAIEKFMVFADEYDFETEGDAVPTTKTNDNGIC